MMSVARACRRFRRNIKHDPRYSRPARRDIQARQRRTDAVNAAERLREARKGMKNKGG